MIDLLPISITMNGSIMEFVVSFDMRAPAFGASADRLYAAALDISASVSYTHLRAHET